jgi:hypothetical protein
MPYESDIPSHYPLARRLMRRLDENSDAVDELEAHASRLPRSLIPFDHWRMRVLNECDSTTVIVLVSQTHPYKYTALAFKADCVLHLLGMLEEKYPESLDELILFLGTNPDRAIGSLMTKHHIEPILTVTENSLAIARFAAAEAVESIGLKPVVGIRPEVINEMVELIARAGAAQYFSGDIDERHSQLKPLVQQATRQPTVNEVNYLLNL